MFRSLRTTVEYTISCFKTNSKQRVKENHGQGWFTKHLTSTDHLVVVEGTRYHKIALELGTSFCFIEIINLLIFPAYVKINGRPYTIKKGQSYTHKQNGRTVILSRLSNTGEQNYYITVRMD